MQTFHFYAAVKVLEPGNNHVAPRYGIMRYIDKDGLDRPALFKNREDAEIIISKAVRNGHFGFEVKRMTASIDL